MKSMFELFKLPMAFTAGLLSLQLLACSDSASPASEPSTPDGGGVPSARELTVFVHIPAYGGGPMQPLANAIVVFEPAEGEPVEKTTDAEGRVRFEADFTKGGVTITGFAQSHTMLTLYGVSPERIAKTPYASPGNPDELALPLYTVGERGWERYARLSGAILGKSDAGSSLTLSASIQGSFFQSTSPSYALTVLRGEPFKLFGIEFATGASTPFGPERLARKMFVLDVAALDAHRTMDLDVSAQASLPFSARKIAFGITGGSAGPYGDRKETGGDCEVKTMDGFTTGISTQL